MYKSVATGSLWGATDGVWLHEVFHAAGAIHDEYFTADKVYSDDEYYHCLANVCSEKYDENGNLMVPWSHWIKDISNICMDDWGLCSRDSDNNRVEIGWYEGADHYKKGVFRAAPNGIMKQTDNEVDSVNGELWLKALYKRVPLFNVLTPNIRFTPIKRLDINETYKDIEERVELNENPFEHVNIRSFTVIEQEKGKVNLVIDVLNFDISKQRVEWFINNKLLNSETNKESVLLNANYGDRIVVKVSDITGIADGLRFDDNQRRVYQTFEWKIM